MGRPLEAEIPAASPAAKRQCRYLAVRQLREMSMNRKGGTAEGRG
jgi:hypothetical protein